MSNTPEQVQAMKKEIQRWLEKHHLANTAGWREVDEFFSRAEEPPLPNVYLVLWSEGRLCDVWRHSLESDWLAEREAEFYAILDKHG